jgi:hypothetical protein
LEQQRSQGHAEQIVGQACAQIQRAGNQHRAAGDVVGLDVLVEGAIPRLQGADGQDEAPGRVPEVRIVLDRLDRLGSDPLDEGQPSVTGQSLIAAHGDDGDVVAALSEQYQGG